MPDQPNITPNDSPGQEIEQPVPPEDEPGQQPEDASSEYTVTFAPSVIANSRPVVVPTDGGGLQIRIALQNNVHSQDIREVQKHPTTGKVEKIHVQVNAVAEGS